MAFFNFAAIFTVSIPVHVAGEVLSGEPVKHGTGIKKEFESQKDAAGETDTRPVSGRTGSNREFGLLFRGETFKVEYLVYISAILLALGLCCYQVRVLGHASRLAAMVRRTGKEESATEKPGGTGSTDQLKQADEVFQRELLKVPTPWGWPGNPKVSGLHHKHPGTNAPAPSQDPAALHRWVDHLVTAKQTTDNGEYLRRRESSMRALLEDRFVSPSHMAAIDYQETKPPLLRDPSEPHDQMDNFPSGRVSKIESKLKAQTGGGALGETKIRNIVYEESPPIRTPWGW